jgi:hypothetical protein
MHIVYNASKYTDQIHMYPAPTTGFTWKVLCDGRYEVETTNDGVSQKHIFIASQVYCQKRRKSSLSKFFSPHKMPHHDTFLARCVHLSGT